MKGETDGSVILHGPTVFSWIQLWVGLGQEDDFKATLYAVILKSGIGALIIWLSIEEPPDAAVRFLAGQ